MPTHPPGPSDVRGHVASFMEMLDTFDICIRIGRSADQLLDFAEHMARVSLNAEIAAAQSSANKEAFMVLAHEAGLVARRMSETIQQIARHSETILHGTLRGVMAARSHEAMAAVRLEPSERPPATRNADRLAAAVRRLVDQIGSIVERIEEAMRSIEGLRTELEHLNRHFALMATYFRIEASRDAQRGHFFVTIADRLQDLAVQTTDCLASLVVMRRYWHRRLSVPLVLQQDDGRRLRIQTLELTRGTATFEAPLTPALQSPLALRMGLASGEIEVLGVVRHVAPTANGQHLIGVEFPNLSPEAHAALLAHIAQALAD